MELDISNSITNEKEQNNETTEFIRELEKGEVPLDDMVNKYTEAMDNLKFCSDKLNQATETVNKILTENGTLEDFKTEE